MPYLITIIVLTANLLGVTPFPQDDAPILIDDYFQITVPCEMTRSESAERIRFEGSDEGVEIVLNRRDVGVTPNDSLTVFSFSDGEFAGMNITEPHTMQSDTYEAINGIPVRTVHINSAEKYLVFSYFVNGSFIYSVRFYFEEKVDELYVEKILNTLKMR